MNTALKESAGEAAAIAVDSIDGLINSLRRVLVGATHAANENDWLIVSRAMADIEDIDVGRVAHRIRMARWAVKDAEEAK